MKLFFNSTNWGKKLNLCIYLYIFILQNKTRSKYGDAFCGKIPQFWYINSIFKNNLLPLF